jgi:hypothetical protein
VERGQCDEGVTKAAKTVDQDPLRRT